MNDQPEPHQHIRDYLSQQRDSWIKNTRWIYIFWLSLVVCSCIGFAGDIIVGSWPVLSQGFDIDNQLAILNTSIMVLLPFAGITYLGRLMLLPLSVVLAVFWIRSLRIQEEYLVAVGADEVISEAKSYLRNRLVFVLAVGGLLPVLLMLVVDLLISIVSNQPLVYGFTPLFMQLGMVWFLVELTLLLTLRLWRTGAGLSVVLALTTCLVVNLISFLLFSPSNPYLNILTGWILASLAAVIWIYNRRPSSGLAEQLLNKR